MKLFIVFLCCSKLGESTSLADIKQLDEEGKLARNLVDPVAKDTVTIPDGGYAILRFHADNPGFWFFHCHIEFHVNIGMGLLIQVGSKEDMPKVPKNFPKCGNWKFSGYEEDKGTEIEKCVSGGSKVKAVALLPLLLFSASVLFMF